MKDTRACAYSYLYEDSALCDYEIATDELASEIGLAMHHVKHIDLCKIIELVYHANGSMRGRIAISNEDVQWLSEQYDSYCEQVGMFKNFVLPQGCIGASHLHCLRSKTKAIVRLLVRIDKELNRVKRPILHEFFNLLSNVFFLMALEENKREQVEERIFISKSYDS